MRKMTVEVHEITRRALLDLLAPHVKGSDAQWVEHLLRGCDCFALDTLPLVEVGDYLVVSGCLRFGGSYPTVIVCTSHSTLDFALRDAEASYRYDRRHDALYASDYEVWHVVEDAPLSEPDPDSQSLGGRPGDCYEVFLYASNVDGMGECSGSVCFDSYFDAKSFARHSMRQHRPARDGKPDGFACPFSVALVTLFVLDQMRWFQLGMYRRGCSGKVTWCRFRAVM